MFTTRKKEELQRSDTTESPPPVSRATPDRRTSGRFPIVRDVRYKIVRSKGTSEAGEGKTVDISSTGVLFTAETPLPLGKQLELSISWPAQLRGKCSLKLVARGRIVRCQGTAVAIEIDAHEFRTAGREGTLPLAT